MADYKRDLTHEELLSILTYNPETGVFVWINAGPKNPRAGQIAGRQHSDGSWTVTIHRKHYRAHRLAWFYVHGKWPQHDIDHINGDRMDNRIANLRDVPHLVNMQNFRRASKSSKSGLLGASPFRGGFVAFIKVGDKKKNLGVYPTAEQAHQAYVAAKRELHEGCTL